MRQRHLILALALFAGLAGTTHRRTDAGEVSFLERFVLATDRQVALQQLIPGTDDYYYYHCLDLQNRQKYQAVDDLLKKWVERHGEVPRVREIRHRQMLLRYAENHRATLSYLESTLGLRFDHQRETVDRAAALPSQLAGELISRAALRARALQMRSLLDGFESSALDWLSQERLTAEQRRALLQRLMIPDVPELPALIVADLDAEPTIAFGTHSIHGQLLLSQLDECLRLRPSLIHEVAFVQAYLRKLRPSNDSDWATDTEEQLRYLERQWSFVSRLSDQFNSLKAHVLYHRLALDITRGDYDKSRLMQYLKLPRPMHYMNRKYLDRAESRSGMADLAQTFDGASGFPPIQQDESVVRHYLQHFLIDAKNVREFEAYLDDNYLKQLFAETKILHGQGNVEQWATMLPPEQFQALKDRVDLEFAPTNTRYFRADEPVVLDVFIKNVPKLIIKTYRMNALNYYQDNGRHLDTSINLDGLVPNHEQTESYPQSPFLRTRHKFELPQLQEPGVYVVDFIGNGQSSRVLIHKGQLHQVTRISAAGHVFVVYNEANQPVKDAQIWMAGKLYAAEENGEIVIPFSTQAVQQNIVLLHGSIATFDSFVHLPESYALRAGIYVPRESLLARRVAPVLIHAGLSINGTPITVKTLENVRLEITSTDLDGISTTDTIADVKLDDARDFVHMLRVPTRMATLTVTIHGQVMSISENKKIDLSATETFAINQVDKTASVHDLQLVRHGRDYFVEVLGKTGEPREDQAVALRIKHRDFRDPVEVVLRSDERGRVSLGPLNEIVSVHGQLENGPAHEWPLVAVHNDWPHVVHTRAKTTIELTYAGPEWRVSRDSVALFEQRGDTWVGDWYANISSHGQVLQIKDLPAGDYVLHLKREQRTVSIRVVDGIESQGYVLGQQRNLELKGERPLHLAHVKVGAEQIEVAVGNANAMTRVHVFAHHFLPPYQPYQQLARFTDNEPWAFIRQPLPSFYLQGRKLGDEYRYVLERRYAKRFPGNMLPRPELLLNPWNVQVTNTSAEQLASDAPMEAAAPAAPESARPEMAAGANAMAESVSTNLDFLATTSLVEVNLIPDNDGIVRIDRRGLHGEANLFVVVVDPLHVVQQEVALPDAPRPQLDLRLADGLDPHAHYSLQKQIVPFETESEFQIANLGSGRFQMVDSLPRVFDLYRTLLPSAPWAEFRFLQTWPQLTAAEKLDHYSRYACHEVNFFLAKKDPEFFAKVIQPYLRQKLHKTFLDHYLIEDDLHEFLRPWNYARLNVVERVLLSQRIASDGPQTVRDLRDQVTLLPQDVDLWTRRFDTAVLGRSLDVAAGAVEEKLSEAQSTAGGLGGGQWKYGAANGPVAARDGRNDDPKSARDASDMLSAEEGESLEGRQARGMVMELGTVADAKDKADRYRHLARDGGRRKAIAAKRLFQTLDTTQEWAENNYYRLPIVAQNADLVGVNHFWIDWAEHAAANKPFRSSHFMEPARNFTEAVMALAVTDLPWESPQHAMEVVEQTIKVRTAGPVILVHEQIEKAEPSAEAPTILVSQNFFRLGERQRMVQGEAVDNFVTGEFVAHRVYGGSVVITNPTTSRQKLDVLIQIPVGAVPVSQGKQTHSIRLQLEPWHTEQIEYFFYFPLPGEFTQFPVHVTLGDVLVAAAEPKAFHVVPKPTEIDETSWAYVSQHGTDEQVVRYLSEQNLHAIDLSKIAFRMGDVEMYRRVLEILTQRHLYDPVLWSYALHHDDAPNVSQFLSHSNEFVLECGQVLHSPILTIDPVARLLHEHLEYHPLVNARAHQIGAQRQIFNDRFHAQYERWLKLLSYEQSYDDTAELITVSYLLLQDRVAEAIELFEKINPQKLSQRLQYDYCRAYLAMSQGEVETARTIANAYREYPVDRWRKLFAVVDQQLRELEGDPTTPIDPTDRNQAQEQLASTQPTLDLELDGPGVRVDYRRVSKIQVRYYLMDIELLFSRNPFVQRYQGQFSYIAPNSQQSVDLPSDQNSQVISLPEKLRNQNVLIEIEADGIRRSVAYYASSMSLQLMEHYGQLQVMQTESKHRLAGVYCKVYALKKDGEVAFYKDGYTDLRGRFDYATLSTDMLDAVDKFAILILSDSEGAMVREVAPPKR